MTEIPGDLPVPAEMLERQRSLLEAYAGGARRRQSRRRTAVAAVAVAVLAALVATPALGLGSRLVELFEGTPATPSVQEVFSSYDEVRKRFEAERRDPYSRVVVEDVRGVISLSTPDGTVRLWAAPTEDGRECWLFEHQPVPSASVYARMDCDPLDADGASLGVFWAPVRPVPIVHVRVHDDDVVQVDVHEEDGSVRRLEVVAGHALGAIEEGAVLLRAIGRDAGGDEVARFPSR